MQARSWSSAAWAIVVRDWRLLKSYRFRVVTMLLSGFFSITLFYYVSRLVNVGAFAGADDYFAFVVVGLVVLQVLNATLGASPGSLRQEVATGTFVRLLMSPFGAASGLLAMLVFPVLSALAVGMFMLAVGATLYGMPVAWETVPLAIPAALLGALAFAPFSVILVAISVHVKAAIAGATWVTALVGLVSGLYFPTSLLPGAVRWIADVQPFTPATDLLRHLLVGSPLREAAWVDILKLVGFTVVLLPVGIVVLRASIRLAQRRGTVLEY